MTVEQQSIEESGVVIRNVRDIQNHRSRFFFTVGLVNRGWPELLVASNGRENNIIDAYHLIQQVVAYWKVQGQAMLGDLPVTLSTNPFVRCELVCDDVARLYIGDVECQLAQVIWPDHDGEFPDSPLYSKDPDCRQVVLPSIHL